MPFFLLTAFCSFILSLAAALLADAHLTERIVILGDFVGLQLSYNRGIAFGVQLPPIIQELLIVAALVAVTLLAVRTLRDGTHDLVRTRGRIRLGAIGYGLIVGGALGNIIDRLPDGLVTDFIQVGSFPIFNIADSCITIGVVFVLASTIKIGRNTQQ